MIPSHASAGPGAVLRSNPVFFFFHFFPPLISWMHPVAIMEASFRRSAKPSQSQKSHSILNYLCCGWRTVKVGSSVVTGRLLSWVSGWDPFWFPRLVCLGHNYYFRTMPRKNKSTCIVIYKFLALGSLYFTTISLFNPDPDRLPSALCFQLCSHLIICFCFLFERCPCSHRQLISQNSS